MVFSPPLTVGEFRERFPAFEGAEDALVEVFLDLAALNVDPTIYGGKAHDAAYYYAADKLALSPFGLANRLVSANGTTTYGVVFQQLMQQCCFGPVLL